MQHFLPFAAAAGLATLAFLLWSDRHKLQEGRGSESGLIPLAKRSGLYLLVAGLVAWAFLLVIEAIPQQPEPIPAPVHVELACEKKLSVTKGSKSLLDCNATLNAGKLSGNPAGTKDEKKSDGSDTLNLTLTALGLFVALVTAISLAVAKNATDEVRRAEEGARKLREDTRAEIEIWKHEDKLQNVLVTLLYNLSRSQIIQSELAINPTPLLEEKLRTWEIMQRWQDQDFHAPMLRNRVESLLATMDNPSYTPHLKRFFDDRDRDACNAFIKMLRTQAGSTNRPDLEEAAQAVALLLRRLKRI